MDAPGLFDVDTCVICRAPEGTEIKLAKVKTEGREKLIECSSKRGDTEIFNYLSSNQPVIN